jgi:plasmid stability protein
MRTTLTLDDDVAAALGRRRAERGTGLRREVNDLLRAGLAAVSAPSADAGTSYDLPTFDPGRALIPDGRALKDLLDDEDDARALRHRA